MNTAFSHHSYPSELLPKIYRNSGVKGVMELFWQPLSQIMIRFILSHTFSLKSQPQYIETIAVLYHIYPILFGNFYSTIIIIQTSVWSWVHSLTCKSAIDLGIVVVLNPHQICPHWSESSRINFQSPVTLPYKWKSHWISTSFDTYANNEFCGKIWIINFRQGIIISCPLVG